jgi:hypothetical protein
MEVIFPDMAGVSDYERSQIDAVTRASKPRPIERGVGLFVMPTGESSRLVHEAAVLPAMRKNRLNLRHVAVAFDDTAALEDACHWLMTAEVNVVDASALNPSVLYVLGLSHGLGRSPILIARVREPPALPFNLDGLNRILYDTSMRGLLDLRSDLARRIRVFLESALNAGGD